MASSCADVIAVVPAAGIGSRMQSDCPKQYLPIGDHTILEHAVASLLRHPGVGRVIVAVSPTDRQFDALPLARNPRVTRVDGGRERADSVLAGLKAAAGAAWVLVHDAARPCLHPDDLNALLALTAYSRVGGILAAHTVERTDLWHALTPQLFPLDLLRDCLIRALDEGATITDEASALEHCGYHPELVAGRGDNIKVTRPEDLALAAFYLTRLTQMENA